MSGNYLQAYAEALLESVERAGGQKRFLVNSLVASLVDTCPLELMSRLLEVVNSDSYDSNLDRATLLRRIGQRLPGYMASRFTERCNDLLFDYPLAIVEALSSMAQHISREEREVFVNQKRAQVMAIDYARDRVRAIHYLGAFCEAKTLRELWKEVMTTEEREADHLSSGDLGISVSPKLTFYATVAEFGPSWLLMRCLEASRAAADSFHSDDVIDQVLKRWQEIRSLGRAKEIQGLSLVLRHGVTRGRRVLSQNLLPLSSSLSDEHVHALIPALQELTSIRY
jgi:hypothetical protein